MEERFQSHAIQLIKLLLELLYQVVPLLYVKQHLHQQADLLAPTKI
jgi:hypothetical protein